MELLQGAHAGQYIPGNPSAIDEQHGRDGHLLHLIVCVDPKLSGTVQMLGYESDCPSSQCFGCGPSFSMRKYLNS